MNNIKVVLFGAGNRAKMFLKQCKRVEVIAIFDNDSKKWGKSFEGINILPPSSLNKTDCKYIVITSSYDEIRQQIGQNFPKLSNKVCSIERMLDYQYIDVQYTKRYQIEATKNYSLLNKKMVVYTGIFGKYDNLREPLVIEQDVDYICFTDDLTLKSDNWKIQYIEHKNDNLAIEVRKYKCLPHIFLTKYDISFWVDANSQIVSPLKQYVELYMGTSGLLLFPHYQRDCIYEEGAANIIQHKENVSKIINQLYQYNAEGFPEHNGLFCGKYIVREHNRNEIIDCMENWYQEICKKSARDQISLPYVLRKCHISPDLCNEHVFDNKWFKCFEHK